MSNKSTNQHADLNQLYHKRKQRLHAPAAQKRQLMEHDLFTTPWQKWLHRAGQVAIAASTLLLVGLVAMQQYDMNHLPQPREYTVVEVHSLEAEKGLLSENVRHKYAQHYQAFLKQKQMFAQHHKKSAILQQLDDGWELKTCDEELVKISDELVSALYDMNSIESSLKAGDRVEIAFDITGIILGISRSEQAAMC